MKKIIVTLLVLLIKLNLLAQTNQNNVQKFKSYFEVSGFIDLYYLLKFQNTNNRSPYVFAYHRANEMNLNLGFIKTTFTADRIKANLALQTGTYAQANYAAEPTTLRNIAEANIEIKLLEKLYFDAGVFPSHIGIESAINQNCYNLTRSFMADGSPYFETGARLKYLFTNDVDFSFLVLNGWQNIQENNTNKAIGSQLTWRVTQNLTVNHSTFYGNEMPTGLAARFRFFQDFWIEWKEILPGFKAVAVFDYMTQETGVGAAYHEVFTGALQLYYRKNYWGIGTRAEHYNDKNQVINTTGTLNGYQASGFSVNYDWYLNQKTMWRFEVRHAEAIDPIFISDNLLNKSRTETFVATSLSVLF